MEFDNGEALNRTASEKKSERKSTAREYVVTAVVAVALAALVRTFFMQPFFIPSSSMYPTLDVDDKIAVSKLEPGLLDVGRGDVVVFEDPGNWLGDSAPEGPRYYITKTLSFVGLAANPDRQFLVKRVIGLPGDSVECEVQGGPVLVNGEAIDDSYINPVGYPCNFEFDVDVPQGKLWVMGDNRTASADSAYHEDVGEESFVPINKVQGKAVVVFWPIGHWERL